MGALNRLMGPKISANNNHHICETWQDYVGKRIRELVSTIREFSISGAEHATRRAPTRNTKARGFTLVRLSAIFIR